MNNPFLAWPLQDMRTLMRLNNSMAGGFFTPTNMDVRYSSIQDLQTLDPQLYSSIRKFVMYDFMNDKIVRLEDLKLDYTYIIYGTQPNIAELKISLDNNAAFAEKFNKSNIIWYINSAKHGLRDIMPFIGKYTDIMVIIQYTAACIRYYESGKIENKDAMDRLIKDLHNLRNSNGKTGVEASIDNPVNAIPYIALVEKSYKQMKSEVRGGTTHIENIKSVIATLPKDKAILINKDENIVEVSLGNSSYLYTKYKSNDSNTEFYIALPISNSDMSKSTRNNILGKLTTMNIAEMSLQSLSKEALKLNPLSFQIANKMVFGSAVDINSFLSIDRGSRNDLKIEDIDNDNEDD